MGHGDRPYSGSIGETSVIAYRSGCHCAVVTRRHCKLEDVMFSVFVGGSFMAFWVFNTIGPDTAMAQMPWYEHLALGGFCFGAVFMATDPVTRHVRKRVKYIYGFPDWCHGYHYPCAQPGLSRRYDACHLADEYFAPLIDYWWYR